MAQVRKLANNMSHSHTHTHEIDYKTAFVIEKLPNSQVKITGEIPFAELEAERNSALVALGKDLEIDGFRKGHVPTPILVKHVGEMAILGEMAERAVAHSYPHIIHEHQIDAIGQPAIEITKLAPNNPLGLKIVVAVVPMFDLPDYVQLAKEVNKEKSDVEVTDEELEKQIKDIQRQKLAYERLQQKAVAKAKLDSSETSPEDAPDDTKSDNFDEDDLPELNDESAKSLGRPGQFESLADLKSKLREHLVIEKTQQNNAKQRASITDKIIDSTTIDLPQILIDSELNQMWAQLGDDIERADLKIEDYLKHLKKTKEDMLKEWSPVAEKRAKLQLILNEIAKKENILPAIEKVNEQTKELLQHFKDADEQRVRMYVASVLMNEEVMKWLESK